MTPIRCYDKNKENTLKTKNVTVEKFFKSIEWEKVKENSLKVDHVNNRSSPRTERKMISPLDLNSIKFSSLSLTQ